MEKSKYKYFSPINNFSASKEAEEKYYVVPGEQEIYDFFKYWNETYKFWLSVIKTQINQSRLEQKIETHKKLMVFKF